MRNPLAPAPIPTQEYIWAAIWLIVALSLLAGIAAVAERGAQNWENVRAAHVQP